MRGVSGSEAVTDGEILWYFVFIGIWSPFHLGTGVSLEITHCVNVYMNRRGKRCYQYVTVSSSC